MKPTTKPPDIAPGGFVLLQNETTHPAPAMARPAEWESPTKMIRLPEAHEEQLKAIAHQLEAGDRLLTTAELEAATRAALQAMRPKDRRAALRAYQRLLAGLLEA